MKRLYSLSIHLSPTYSVANHSLLYLKVQLNHWQIHTALASSTCTLLHIPTETFLPSSLLSSAPISDCLKGAILSLQPANTDAMASNRPLPDTSASNQLFAELPQTPAERDAFDKYVYLCTDHEKTMREIPTESSPIRRLALRLFTQRQRNVLI